MINFRKRRVDYPRQSLARIALACQMFTLQIAWAAPSEVVLQPRTQGPSVRFADTFSGVDIGAQVNAAYESLPASGGAIILNEGGSFSTPIVFGTLGKPVLLIGLPGDIVTLVYTGSSGTAITFDYGTGHKMGHGMRDLTLTGPGNATNSIGVTIGGANGAEGIAFRDFKIQGFGTNLQLQSHTWLAFFEHGMLRDGGVNFLLPSGLIQAGEQITFNHVTFADAPPPHQNSVWIQGGGAEVIFTDCSFDHAQLRIGNGEISAAQVAVKGSHFENPNYSYPESVFYDYVVVDHNYGNLMRISDSYFLQDAPTGGPSELLMVNGGRVVMEGVGMYTPAGSPLMQFAVVSSDGSLSAYGFNDLSGNISGKAW